jgi:hypothetical protein
MKKSLGMAKQALELAQSRVGQLNVQLGTPQLDQEGRRQLEAQLRFQQNAIIYWGNEFRKLGGDVDMIMPVDNLYARRKSAEEILAEKVSREQKKHADQVKADDQTTFNSHIQRVRNQQTWLMGQCTRLFRNTKEHWDAGVAVHLFAGEKTFRPLVIGGGADVTTLLDEAVNLRKEGRNREADVKLREAAFKVYFAAMQLDSYESNIGIGAERTEAAIKVVAALSMLIASGGTALSVGGAMAVAAAGEGAMQGTLLAAKGIDGKETITSQDVTAAALEVAIAAGSAGLGAYAKKIGQALVPGVLNKVLKTQPTQQQIDWVVERFANYVSANSGYIAKRLTGLDKDKSWNFWLTIIAPIAGEIPVELTKEQSLNKIPFN